MVRTVLFGVLCLPLCASLPADAQSLNVDLGPAGSPQPAAAYGGAANQPGHWNPVGAAASGVPLLDLTANPTTVTATVFHEPSAGNVYLSDHDGTTGDDAALLDDLQDVGSVGENMTYRFDGLEPGTYQVTTYAFTLESPVHFVEVTVDGVTQGLSANEWPGMHVLGETYALHTAVVAGDGRLDVFLHSWEFGFGVVNGFQLEKECVQAMVPYCTATPNSSGSPAQIQVSGSASIGANDLVLAAHPVPTFHSAVFVYSPDQVQLPLGDGFLCVGDATLGFVVRLPSVTSDVLGIASLAVDLASPPVPEALVTPGSTWNYPAWFRDLPAGGSGFNFSTAIAVTFCP